MHSFVSPGRREPSDIVVCDLHSSLGMQEQLLPSLALGSNQASPPIRETLRWGGGWGAAGKGVRR